MFSSFVLTLKDQYYQKPSKNQMEVSPTGSWPPMGHVGGNWGLFRGPLTCQITPFFSRFTLCADMVAPQYWKGTLRQKNTTMVKSIHLHRCIDPWWGLGVLRGASLRPQNTSKWVGFKEMLCFSSFLLLFWLWRTSTTRNQVIFNWKYLPQIYDLQYGL